MDKAISVIQHLVEGCSIRSTASYDPAGNVTSDGVHSYQYDAENRLVSVDGGANGTFAYDHANRRVKKTYNGKVVHYIWDGSQVISEVGSVQFDYVYFGSRLVARNQFGVLQYYHQDRLSTRLITDSAGTVVGSQDHMPFGESGGAMGVTEKHRFTSYERDDESGTDYAINRQHQFANGRFMQPDPLQGDIGVPQSLNRYAYTINDPLSFVDPLGLSPGDVTCFVDYVQQDCSMVDRLIRTGMFESVSYTSGAVTRTVDRNDYYENLEKPGPWFINPDTNASEPGIYIGVAFNETQLRYDLLRLWGEVYQLAYAERDARQMADMFTPPAGRVARSGSWIAREIYKTLQREVGKADARKFAAALTKPIVSSASGRGAGPATPLPEIRGQGRRDQ